MSHELRTPFRFVNHLCLELKPRLNVFYKSSFYGLLDLLSGTELNPGQREIGKFGLTAIYQHRLNVAI